jgi:hypothetical protein
VKKLYVSKSSVGNGEEGVFQVLNGNFPNATLAQVVNGTGAGVPTGGTNNTIVQLLGNQATNPNTNGPSPLTPFGFFFANPTTLYVADEGNPSITLTDANGQSEMDLVSDPLAGLQKWVLVPGNSPFWQLVYILQDELQINKPQNITDYTGTTLRPGCAI